MVKTRQKEKGADTAPDNTLFDTLKSKNIKFNGELLRDLKARNFNGNLPIEKKDLIVMSEEFLISPENIEAAAEVIQEMFAEQFNLNNAPRIRKLEAWLSSHYEFRRNIITARLQYRKKNGSLWLKANENEIWRQIQLHLPELGHGPRGGELSIPISDVCTILESEYVPEYNPFKDYFQNLPPWDDIDHINKLSTYITCDDQDFWQSQFKKALVRMIACTLDNIENRIVMTLIQDAQESGKSSFIRFLCPDQLKDYYKESPMEHNKDSDIALAENFIWNLEELADLNKKEIAEMKAMISRTAIKQRRAYARYEEAMPRIVNFWASTNKVEFLADTQNTRWLCFYVRSVSHDYHNKNTGVKNVEIDKVWAQAYHLYKTGFQYQLDQQERAHRDFINQAFESMPEEKQLIMRYFKPAEEGQYGARYMLNYEIKEYLNNNTSAKTRLNENNIGRSMKQLGFVQKLRKHQGKTVRGYWLIPMAQPMEIGSTDTQKPFMQKHMFEATQSDDIELPFN